MLFIYHKTMFRVFFSLIFLMLVANAFGQNDSSKKEEKAIELEEVTVIATRSEKKLKNVPIVVQLLTKEDIYKSQSTDFQSFLENEFSGINFTYDGGRPNINMMGFSGKYVLFLIDGERVAGETFENIDYERIDLDNIERIEIIKGASSSLYGSNAIGGVINIITKNARKSFDVSSSYLYDTNIDHRANLSIGSKQKWGSLQIGSFYKMREPYLLKDTEQRKIFYTDGRVKELPHDYLHIAGFTNYGINPKLNFQISPKWDLELKPTYYFSERNDGTENAKKVLERYYNYALSLKSTYELSQNESIKLTGSFDRYSKFNYYRLLNEQEKNYENTLKRVSTQYNNLISGKHTLVAGAEVLVDELISLRFNEKGTEASKDSKNYTLFAQQDWILSDRFTLVAGVRMDYHSLFQEHFTFRLSGMYTIDEFTLRGGYSSGFRSPTIKELYTNWFHPWGGGFQIKGNETLKPELSDNFNFSVDYSTKKLNITAITQYSVVTDKIDFVWSDSHSSIDYTNFKGATRIISSEFSVAYRLNKFFRLKSSYAFYDIEKRLSDHRPHTFTLKGEYSPSDSLKYIPSLIISGKYVSSTTLFSSEERNTFEEYYSVYEPYWIWRLQTSMKLPLGFVLNAGVNNLLNYKANTVGFYSSISPGRTFYIGVKYSY